MKVSQLIKALLLRGRVLHWWSLRRANQTDDAYLKNQVNEMLCDSGRDESVPLPGPVVPRPALRRVLFIGDCMWEQDQIFPEIRKICELDVLDLRPLLSSPGEPTDIVARAVANHAKETAGQDPDLIILYLRPSLLSEETFSLIRARWSSPLIGMNLDDRVEFFPHGILKCKNEDYARWITSFDLNLTSSLTAMDWYRRRCAAVRYFPQGFKPDDRYAAPPATFEIIHPVSFVGSWKSERGKVMDELSSYGLHPVLFGKGWPDGRWIEEPAAVFRSSQINLGIGYASASRRIANAKGRDIECPGSGACYLTTYHWELSEMFEIGKEVLAYRNTEELVEMLAYYTKRPAKCLEIARAAHRRARAEHTWEKRWRDLFLELGFESGKS